MTNIMPGDYYAARPWSKTAGHGSLHAVLFGTNDRAACGMQPADGWDDPKWKPTLSDITCRDCRRVLLAKETVR